MPFVIYRGLTEDSALLDQASHFDIDLESGRALTEMEVPLEFEIDLTSEGRRMSSLFVMPAFLARRELYNALVAAGVDNVDSYAAVIRNTDTGEQFDNYLFLNVIGVVACADLAHSDYAELGPGMKVIDQVAIKADQIPDVHMFRLAEDQLKIVVSDKVHRHLLDAGFNDIHFEPVKVV